MAKFTDKNLLMEPYKTVDGRDVSADGEKLDAATEKNIAKTLVLRSASGKADLISSNAEKLYTPRLITFKGGATGNFLFDGSKNLDVELSVNAGNHNHNDIYYTIEQIDKKFLDFSPDDHKHKSITSGSGIEYFKWDASEPAIVQIRWAGSSGDFGVAQAVARSDHRHDSLYPSLDSLSTNYGSRLRIDNNDLVLINNKNQEISRVAVSWSLSLGSSPGSGGMRLNSTDLNTESNRVVHTDVNGHVQFGWIKVNSGVTATAPSYFYVDTGDNYLRKVSSSTVLSSFGISGNAVTQHGHRILYNVSHPDWHIYSSWDSARFRIYHSVGYEVAVNYADSSYSAHIATMARYADYAEYYSVEDPSVKIGSVLSISKNPDIELTECMTKLCANVVGVRSSEPGFTINGKDKDKENSIAVALLGKTPVRIIGQIEKGDSIISAGNGCAMKLSDEMRLNILVGDKVVFGYALESNSDVNEKLVMCFISK